MELLEILKILMALLNIGFGVWSVLQPEVIAKASSYTLDNARGRTEMRILSGGFFIGMGLGAILFGSVLDSADVVAYQVVGMAWVCAAAVRLLNLAMERNITDRSFWVLFASELIPGVILLLPM